MSDLTDAISALKTEVDAQIFGAIDAQAAAARTVARLQALSSRVAQLAALAGAPTAPEIPEGANLVRIGAATYPLAGVNPTAASNPVGAAYDGCRGPDQLILCLPPWSRSGTNAFGAEVAVVGGRVTGEVLVGGRGGIAIPTDGYVLSGHGKAGGWLAQAAQPGAVVEVARVEKPPAPAVTGRTLAMYLMDGVGHVSQIPPNVTQIRVAFLRDGGLVEWGGDSPAKTRDDLTSWRAARPGRQVLLSIGGAGGRVSVTGIPGVVRRLEQEGFPVDGIDFDIEGGALPVEAAVAATVSLAAGREASWLTAFTPPGGPPVTVYLDAARRCKAAGLRVQFGSQLYDAEVSLSAALGVLQREVDALGPESVLVGMMVANDAKHWTVDQCEANMRAIVGRWPAVGGAFLWESARAGTADWARRVGAVLGL